MIENKIKTNIILAVVFILMIIYGGPLLVRSDLKALLLMSFGMMAFILGCADWRKSLIIVTYLIILEGAIRKWLLPDYQKEIYFAKDVILCGTYVNFFLGSLSRPSVKLPKIPLFLLLLSIFWGIGEIFNGALPNKLVGLFGFKSYFFYSLLIFLVPQLFKDKESLFKYIKQYGMWSMPVCVLGIFQFFSPPDSPLVSYLEWSEEPTIVSMVGDYPRISGTFSYISGYAVFLIVIVLYLFVFLSIKSNKSAFEKSFCFLGLLFAMGNLFMTGSRTPFIVLLIFVMVIFILEFMMKQKVKTNFFLKMIVTLGVVILCSGFFFNQAVKGLWNRSMESSDISERLENILKGPWIYASAEEPFGSGIGSTHQIAPLLVAKGAELWNPIVQVEEESSRVVIEMGIIGFILFYLTKLTFFYFGCKYFSILQDISLKIIILLSVLFQIYGLVTFTVFNNIASFYYWFMVGLSFLALRLDNLKAETKAVR